MDDLADPLAAQSEPSRQFGIVVCLAAFDQTFELNRQRQHLRDTRETVWLGMGRAGSRLR
jgi:hypothetical protein